MLTGDAVAVKLATLYRAFLENEAGLPITTLCNVFREFELNAAILKGAGDVVRALAMAPRSFAP